MNIKLMPEILLDTLCRFWTKVDRKSDFECWNWLACVCGDGYGHIKINDKMYRVHRIAYYIHYQKDPGELLICHKCNNGLCMNPHHLFLGTVSENMQHAFASGNKSNQGILSSQTKLTEKDIQEIRRLQGIASNAQIGKLYNIVPQTVSYILLRKTWTHVH